MSWIVPDRRLTFGKSPVDFAEQLASDAKHLRLIDVERAQDMALDAALHVQGKYALTTTGSQQYLNLVAGGLPGLTKSLLQEQHEDVVKADAGRLVAKLVNGILKHREPAVLRSRMIVCDRRKQLDGAVSRRYASISNQRVYELFENACELMRFKAEFFQAAITGRDMLVVLASRKPIVEVRGTRLYPGTVCQNSETAGRAIRATNVLIDSDSGTWSAAPFSPETRIPHIRSRKLRERMMQMSDTLATRQLKSREISEAYDVAMRKSVAPSWEEANVMRFKRKLTALGDQFAVSAKAIDAVLDLLTGEQSFRAPTLYTASLACLAVANRREVGHSLPLRQLASKLILG